jgi:deoxyribonuclease IV
MEPILRVREILRCLDTPTKAQLKKMLPKDATMPDVETEKYPSALLKLFPKENAYSLLGIVTEHLLRLESDELSLKSLLEILGDIYPEATDDQLNSVCKSKTTAAFLNTVKQTRIALEAVAHEPLQYDQVLQYQNVQGHPDGLTADQIFEVKLTGLLKKCWTDFLFQTFAYVALYPEAKHIYLVLPLQQTVWHYSINGWKGHTAFRDLLCRTGKKLQEHAMADMLIGSMLRETYLIGHHAPKFKTLTDTVRNLPDYRKPYQIFLGAPQMTKLQIADGELAAAAGFITDNRISLYVHSQYIINLCSLVDGDDWNTNLLIKNLQYAAAIGCKGVVVHVGKSTDKPLPLALKNMKKNIRRALQFATESCPLLLETPAGQGTETLKAQEEFIDFVSEFDTPRLRVCLDTCHVFACGHKPVDYIRKVCEKPEMLKLIHYNDSATPCGSCVDRHAYMGSGHIGMDGMKEIAELCGSKGLPMVIE